MEEPQGDKSVEDHLFYLNREKQGEMPSSWLTSFLLIQDPTKNICNAYRGLIQPNQLVCDEGIIRMQSLSS